MNRFDYLNIALGPVIDGLEDHEKIYALEQMSEYNPIRTLGGESGRSAIYRCELTDEHRAMVAAGADVLIEILHFGGPLAPSRAMLLNQSGLTDEEKNNLSRWCIAQMKIARKPETV